MMLRGDLDCGRKMMIEGLLSKAANAPIDRQLLTGDVDRLPLTLLIASFVLLLASLIGLIVTTWQLWHARRKLARFETPAAEHTILPSQTEIDAKRQPATSAGSTAWLRSYFDQPLVGIAITTPAHQWLEVNASFCDLLGYRQQELAGRGWVDCVHPEDAPAILAEFDQMHAGKTDGFQGEYRFLRKDGRVIWADTFFCCERNSAGAVENFVSFAYDIDRRKQSEEALNENQRLLADLVENSG